MQAFDSNPSLSDAQRLRLLELMLESRAGDLREQSLIRQGKGWFHVSGMGHEALAVAGLLLKDGDFLAGYYRDRPIALARGMNTPSLALSFFAKRASPSGGRQMPAHYSNRQLGIFSIASVVASSLLPACGLAWGLKLDRKPGLVLTTVGDAGTRQGDFFEAVAFALERQLPVVFLIEDNGIGISTVTERMHPLGLEMLNADQWLRVDGCDVNALHAALQPAMAAARAGAGPRFLWCRTERLSSHSSADDQRKYRDSAEMDGLDDKDPIHRLRDDLIAVGALDPEGYEKLRTAVEKRVRDAYAAAFEQPDPEPADLLRHVASETNPSAPALELTLDREAPRMVDAINATFHAALRASRDVIFFGQDIEDPKGGVFSLTKGLSSAAPEQVFNSPLAESTIIGVAAGLAAYGKRPVFEIQFADYIWPGFNQLVTQLSTLHWRTNGEWSAPAVIYAPCGAYLPGGALWHSQSNESALAHFPGLHVAVPARAEDAAGIFWSALHGGTPTVILIPKHLMWHPQPMPPAWAATETGAAVRLRTGSDLTVVAWGNTTEVVEQALAQLEGPERVEVIDLRWIVPLDMETIAASVRRTGRLLVVQEDAESCSVGQGILARICSDPDLFNHLRAAPALVSKPDVNIGYNPVLEYAALPDAATVVARIRSLLGVDSRREPLSATATDHLSEADNPTMAMMQDEFSPDNESARSGDPGKFFELRVPILGEGITSARVISLIAQPGDTIEADDPVCEVETDKALFPIEAPHNGRLLAWKIAEEDEVAVDQVIAELELDGPVATGRRAAGHAATQPRPTAPEPTPRPTEGGLPPRVLAQLKHVVPAHMSVKAGWEAIRLARAEGKSNMGGGAPSPTVMVAWAIVQAMKKHPIFCCTIQGGDSLQQNPVFDFGVAVALQQDALETAVVQRASELDGENFIRAYHEAVEAVRAGQSRSKANVPLILTSMGGFDVREAQPLVVPPAIATLFLGEAHWELNGPEERCERAALCLSFDHRWLNGAAGAQFLQDVKRGMESFELASMRA